MVMSQSSLYDFRAGTSAVAAGTVILTLFFEDSAGFLRSARPKVKPAEPFLGISWSENRFPPFGIMPAGRIIQRFVSGFTTPLGTFREALRY